MDDESNDFVFFVLFCVGGLSPALSPYQFALKIKRNMNGDWTTEFPYLDVAGTVDRNGLNDRVVGCCGSITATTKCGLPYF